MCVCVLSQVFAPSDPCTNFGTETSCCSPCVENLLDNVSRKSCVSGTWQSCVAPLQRWRGATFFSWFEGGSINLSQPITTCQHMEKPINRSQLRACCKMFHRPLRWAVPSWHLVRREQGVTTMLELKCSILLPLNCNPILSFFCCVSGRFRKNVYRIHNIFGAQTLFFWLDSSFIKEQQFAAAFNHWMGSPPKKNTISWKNEAIPDVVEILPKKNVIFDIYLNPSIIQSLQSLGRLLQRKIEAWLVRPPWEVFSCSPAGFSGGVPLHWCWIVPKALLRNLPWRWLCFGKLAKRGKNPRRCTFSIQEAGFSSKPRIGSLWICKKQRPKTIVTKALNSIVRGFLVCFTKPQRSDGEALALAEGRRVIFDICWGGTPELFVDRRFCIHWHLLFLISSSISVNWTTMPSYFVVHNYPYCREKKGQAAVWKFYFDTSKHCKKKKVVKHVFT